MNGEAKPQTPTHVDGRDNREVDAVLTDRHVRGRTKALMLDLSNDDWTMALRDLERLYRALQTGPKTDVDEPTHEIPDIVGASIYHDDDGTIVEEFCQGPDELGKCPRAKEGQHVACAGKRLATRGWDFGVATDAELCPLLTLGLVRRNLAGFLEVATESTYERPRREVQYV